MTVRRVDFFRPGRPNGGTVFVWPSVDPDDKDLSDDELEKRLRDVLRKGGKG